MNSFGLPGLSYGFIALTLTTAFAFYALTGRHKGLLAGFAVWLTLHAALAQAGFYTVPDSLPPRLALALVPTIVCGAVLAFGSAGNRLWAGINLEHLHYLHAVRLLVELVFLNGLYAAGLMAEVVTFHGQNMDVVAGVTGPLVGWLVFRRRLLSRKAAVVWNVGGILLLLWTISRAVLSAPSPYQQYGFDQPTIAIFHFPFIWLPALVAPLMLWAHFIALRKLTSTIKLCTTNSSSSSGPPVR